MLACAACVGGGGGIVDQHMMNMEGVSLGRVMLLIMVFYSIEPRFG